MSRYYTISYEGRELLKIHAPSACEAKRRAIATYQREGRRGMNLARLVAEDRGTNGRALAASIDATRYAMQVNGGPDY